MNRQIVIAILVSVLGLLIYLSTNNSKTENKSFENELNSKVKLKLNRTSTVDTDYSLDTDIDAFKYAKSNQDIENVSFVRQIEVLDVAESELKNSLMSIVINIKPEDTNPDILYALKAHGHEAYPAIGSLIPKLAVNHKDLADETIDEMLLLLDSNEDEFFVSDLVIGLFNTNKYNYDYTKKIVSKLNQETYLPKKVMLFGLLASNRFSIEEDNTHRKMALDDPDPEIQKIGKEWESHRHNDFTK